MADAVEHALAHDRVLVCEAGTGTGKTLAYLVPAILSGKKIVVSTATRALQEQIFNKDIPLIRQTLGLRVDAALMKGLSNYLCLRRFGEYRASPEAVDPHAARVLAIIEEWAAKAKSGDVADLIGLTEDEPVWREVSSSSETRIGQDCPHFNACFVTRMKREAEAARIVVVNHHLFFADLALRGPHGGAALPNYDAVIFDEAHQLEDIATDFFGIRVSSARVQAMLRDAERAFVAAGLSDKLLRKGEGAAIVDIAREGSGRFFAEIARSRGANSSASSGRGGAPEGKATIDRDFWGGELLTSYHKLDAALEALAAYGEARQTSEAVEVVVRRAKQLREDLASIVFKFLRSRLGLESDDIPVEELEVASPFDYPSRALVYLPRDLPDPSDPAWLDAARARIGELIEATGGGAFILSTSKRVMLALHSSIRRAPGRPVFVQGEAPKRLLLERFRAAKNAVLVATMSFWEGVDVPGQALRLIVIDKIPFQVPTDPVVMARSAAIEQSGKNPFSNYHVPSAAITLKQGFGRLIRTRKDAGIVAILDRRIHTKNYGRALIERAAPRTCSRPCSLPDPSLTTLSRARASDRAPSSRGARACSGSPRRWRAEAR